MSAADDDTWDPFADPEGETASKSILDRLTENEARIFRTLVSGQPLREVEIDRLITLGLARRDARGKASRTDAGEAAARACRGQPLFSRRRPHSLPARPGPCARPLV